MAERLAAVKDGLRFVPWLRASGFTPEDARIWRWVAEDTTAAPVVKFELLADLQDQPAEVTISFDACENLGAVNLRGTGFAARDIEIRELSVRDGDVTHTAEVNVSGLAGFLLAKTSAAFSRRKTKDWYDIAQPGAQTVRGVCGDHAKSPCLSPSAAFATRSISPPPSSVSGLAPSSEALPVVSHTHAA